MPAGATPRPNAATVAIGTVVRRKLSNSFHRPKDEAPRQARSARGRLSVGRSQGSSCQSPRAHRCSRDVITS